jgi:hypothetical protein
METKLLENTIATKALFASARSKFNAMGADSDNNLRYDTQGVGVELLKIDALLSLDDPDLHNKLTGERLNGEILKDRIDILYAENAKLMSCVGAALSESITALRYRHIAQFLKLNPIKNGVIHLLGKTVPVMMPDGKSITTIELLEKAIDQVLSTPMGPLTAQVLKHFEPSDVNTVLGSFPAVFLDKTMRNHIGETAKKETCQVHIVSDEDKRMHTNLGSIVSQWVEDLCKFYDKYAPVLGNVDHLRLGWDMLKFQPLAGRGSWRDFFEESPLMFSRSNWSLPVSDPLEAGFMLRMQPYTEDNQFGLTREEHVVYRIAGTNLSHIGLRGSHFPVRKLTDPIPIRVARNDLANINTYAIYDYELNRYQPYSKWAGEGGLTYKERSVSVAALSRVLGISYDATEVQIRNNISAYGAFFEVNAAGDIFVKERVNPVWATWIEQSAVQRMREVHIPYFGATEAWLRVGPEEWTAIETKSQFVCNQDDESMGFEVSNLITGGSLDFREAK